MGVWKQTGPQSYMLSHFALSYDPASGDLNGYVTITENVTVDSTGNKYSGNFSLQVDFPAGNPVSSVSGVVLGERIVPGQ